MSDREVFEAFVLDAQPDGSCVSFRRDERDGGAYFYPGIERLWKIWAARSTPKQGEAQELAFRLIDEWLGLGPDGAAYVREQLATLAGSPSVEPLPQVEPAGWQPIETAPKSGEFLLGVWEGDWNKPRTRFRIYHATGYSQGPSWAQKGSYRTEEGGAYELAGWMVAPKEPKP